MRFVLMLLVSFALTSMASAQVTWTAGAPGGTSGGALDFDGTNWLDTGINGTELGGNRVDGGLDYTVSMWLNADTDDQAWFFGYGNRGIHLGVRDGGDNSNNPGVQEPLAQGHWGADTAGSTTITSGDWFHATFTYDADGGSLGTGEQTIYVNGVLDAQADQIAPGPNAENGDASNTMFLGARNGGGNGPQWDGQIDDLAIWNSTALSESQVADLYGGTGALDLGANAYWNFEDSIGGDTALNSGTLGGNLVGIAPVPEPSSFALVLCCAAAGFLRRKRQ